jgi:hypothetical protein
MGGRIMSANLRSDIVARLVAEFMGRASSMSADRAVVETLAGGATELTRDEFGELAFRLLHMHEALSEVSSRRRMFDKQINGQTPAGGEL